MILRVCRQAAGHHRHNGWAGGSEAGGAIVSAGNAVKPRICRHCLCARSPARLVGGGSGLERAKMRRQGSVETGRGRVDAGGSRRFRRAMTRQQGSGFVSSFRLTGRAFVLGTAALAMLTGADAGCGALLAQGKLDARYTVTLAGLPIGRGAWVIDIGEESFTASASGATSGLLQVFASGHGQSASRGSRSEERRVGKECREGRAAGHGKRESNE